MAKELIKQINLPFFINQHELAITSSIGIVLYPEDGTDPGSPAAKCRHRDVSCQK